jgi:hypothetical protein
MEKFDSAPAPTPGSAPSSASRRRDVLRRIGQGSLIAGASAPLAALATGNGRKHCFHRTKTQQVHASLSGMNSVVMSAQPGSEAGGHGCSKYTDPTKVPASCKTQISGSQYRCKTFNEIWPCAPTDTDSHGKKMGESGCFFDMTIDTLCAQTVDCDEKHWVTAYCNASPDNSSALNYPYSCAEVKGFRSDANKKLVAMEFFKYCMENRA